jgi:hypothetical protein
MRINVLQRLLLKSTLFFCWFISFALFNFESANWGLQVGWVCAFLFCVSYSPSALLSHKRFFRERTFISACRVLLVIFGFTALALLMLALGVVILPEPEMLSRMLGHTGYVVFYSWVFVCVFHALRRERRAYWQYFRWFFVYPFAFIAVWGIYQNLTTYGIAGEYIDVFNNSSSTGFTYERFRDAHRVSSVFPEPSEYSYYLAMMGPIIWACYRNKLPWNGSRAAGVLLLTLWIVQAAMVKSLSFFLAVPVVLYVCMRHVEGRRLGLNMILSFCTLVLLVILIMVIGLSGRITETAAGDDGSVLARYVGLLEALDLFLRSPVVGFGYGVVRGLDALSFTLASFGLAGTLTLWIALQRFLRSVRLHVTPILSGAILCLIAGCILSNNVFDHIFIWVLFAVTAACPQLPQREDRRTFTPATGDPLHIRHNAYPSGSKSSTLTLHGAN